MATAAGHQFVEAIRAMDPVSVPPEQQAELRALSALLETATTAKSEKCRLLGPKGERVVIPDSLFSVLARAAEVLASGDSITLVPVGRELTTQQSANLLNVSRQYLVRLLEEMRIPFTKTGKHRRLKLADVLTYKTQRDSHARKTLDELTRLSQEAGGYNEIE